MIKLRRFEKRLAFWLIEKLVKHYRWHNSVLNTSVPNVPCLKVVQLTVVNSYGQTHVFTGEKRMGMADAA